MRRRGAGHDVYPQEINLEPLSPHCSPGEGVLPSHVPLCSVPLHWTLFPGKLRRWMGADWGGKTLRTKLSIFPGSTHFWRDVIGPAHLRGQNRRGGGWHCKHGRD